MSLLFLFLFALLLLFPQSCLTGARNGLLLWFHNVLPTLFPFLFLSSLLLSTGVAHSISRVLRPILSPLLHISEDSCYAVLIGLVTGLPLGAKTCSDLVSYGHISRQEGQYLLCFCNNFSPMFLLGFLGTNLLGLSYQKSILFWLCILFSGYVTGQLYRLIARRHKSCHPICYEQQPAFHTASTTSGLDQALEDGMTTAIRTITHIGGYIILFSILGQLLLDVPLPQTSLSNTCQAMLTGILELTTGSSFVAALSIPLTMKTALIAFLAAFGGLSGILQTKSVIVGSGLSIITYIHAKLFHAILAAAISFLIFPFIVL